MKFRAAVILLAVLLLCGCGKAPSDLTYEYDGLVLTLPAEFSDLSQERYADGYDFLHGSPQLSVLGVRTGKQYLRDFTLREYAELILRKNELTGEPELENKMYFIKYTATVDESGTRYSYITVFFETEADFWAVQAYCPEEKFQQNEQKIWDILQNIRIK